MTPANRTDPELDSLIDELTVDCYGEDEQLMGFANAFDDVSFPRRGTVIGEEVDVQSIGVADDRPDLIATCKRGDRIYEIALLNVSINTDADTSRLIPHTDAGPPHATEDWYLNS